MKKQSVCMDFYHLKLEVGQRVIPICSDALFANIDGIISKINYSDYYNVWFIDISNEKGNVLLKDVNPCYYSTPERFAERKNQNFIYSLSFYNDLGNYITHIPLIKNINPEHEIPKDITYVTLDEKIIEESNGSYSENLGIFILNKNTRIEKTEKDSNIDLILNKDLTLLGDMEDCYIKTFDLEEKFNEYIRDIFLLFNKSESINIGNITIPYNAKTNNYENLHTINEINQKKKVYVQKFSK